MAKLTDAQKLKSLRDQMRMMIFYEMRMFRDVKKILNFVGRLAAQEYERNNRVDISGLLISQTFRFESVFKKNYEPIINSFSTQIRGETVDRIEKKALSGLFANYVKEWIAENSLRQAQLLSATTHRDIMGVIDDGAKEGLGQRAIATAIRKKIGTTLSTFRASTIARTETHNAAMWASVESVRDVNREYDTKFKKLWLPTEDERTRPDHAVMINAPAIELHEDFIVGGVRMQRPGDPSAPPEQVCNCRCVMVYEE